jgi:hypothetical protein
MGDAKSIDPKLLCPELLAISKKKVKTDDDKAILRPLLDKTLSEGAKTYLKGIAKELIYDFRKDVDVKYMRKGLACEDTSIELLNTILFKSYEKNANRVETDLFSGECDILTADYIRDVKTSWDLDTFPCLTEDAHNPLYEYQGRAYMHIYDRPLFHLDYLMVSTPEEMRKYEQASLHEVDHIDPLLRHTTISYPRDMEIEERMLVKCRAAQAYVEQIKLQIFIDHKI